MVKPFSTDTGTRFDEEEALEARQLCDCQYTYNESYLGYRNCPNWNWHVYKAIDIVATRRKQNVFDSMVSYFQATGV